MLTSKPIGSFDKLINTCQNLVKAHLTTLRQNRQNVEVDLLYQLLKHLFLENVLENQFVKTAILNNQIQTIADFEEMAKLNFTQDF